MKVSSKTLNFNLRLHGNEWKNIYDDPNPHFQTLPEPLQGVTHMERLCFLKVFRPDKVIHASIEFIKSDLGKSNPLKSRKKIH